MKHLALQLAAISVLALAGCGGAKATNAPGQMPVVTDDATLNLTGTEQEPNVVEGETGKAHKTCDNGKVLICHVPPGNADAAHTICVSENAVDAHQKNHPDTVGECVAAAGDAGSTLEGGKTNAKNPEGTAKPGTPGKPGSESGGDGSGDEGSGESDGTTDPAPAPAPAPAAP